MPRDIDLRFRSGSTTPSAANFNVGEPAWDSTAGKLYVKNAAGSMIEVGASGGASSIVEADTPAGFPATGSASVLYLARDSRRLYSWTAGGVYAEVGAISAYDSRWDLFLPPAPTGVTGTAGNAQVSLTWTAPTVAAQTPITDYVIQYSSNSGSTWTTFSDGTSSSTSATVTGLTNGTAYVFRVAAVNAVGTGSYSSASSSVTPANVISASWLVVAGGGGGGAHALNDKGGAGGGAGGLRTGSATLTAGVAYSVVVGRGGAGGAAGANKGESGFGSTFSSTSCTGGGGGGSGAADQGLAIHGGLSGGSGGGATKLGAVGAGTSGEGNNGGSATSDGGGGGGGSTAVGSNSSTAAGAAGGAGTDSSITGVSVNYAAGGGGGAYSGSGGAAGGSSGGAGGAAGADGTAGTAGTGGGGGGAGGGANAARAGLAGGSGVVIVAIAGTVTATVSGFTLGTSYTRDTSTRAGYTVFRFTFAGSGDQTSGTITF